MLQFTGVEGLRLVPIRYFRVRHPNSSMDRSGVEVSEPRIEWCPRLGPGFFIEHLRGRALDQAHDASDGGAMGKRGAEIEKKGGHGDR